SGLSKALRASLDNSGALEGRFVAREYPTAARALERVETLLSKAPEGKVVGVGWQNIERVRKMLLNKGSGPDETRVLGEMRDALDDWIENSVHDALVSGDPKFLDDLVEARNLYRQYKQITGNSSSIIRKMADGSANSEQIANWLYGASRVGGRTDASNTLREIKTLIGADHPAIGDLKRGVTMRLFEDRTGEIKPAGKLASDILDFVNNKGHELAKELYGADNLSELRRFAMVLKRTVPDPKATNPSRSGHTVTRQVWDGLTSLAPVLGLAANSFTGMLAGFGVRVGVNQAARRAAQKAVNSSIPSPGASFLQYQRSIGLPATRATVLGAPDPYRDDPVRIGRTRY
ncbi:MAG: hypothetical protein KDE20_23145, partial [Caldilineaceae bacterium]|nr:hypothetical protein [Caldilineaceae bacterium]